MEKQVRRTPAEIAEHVARYIDSGMTQAEYCQEHGINKATLAYWLKRHREEKRAETGSFIQMSAVRNESWVEVRFINGTVIRIGAPVDLRFIKELIG